MSFTTYAMLKAAERQLQLAFETNDTALMQDALRRIEQLTRPFTGPAGPASQADLFASPKSTLNR
jgi:hypothetical protein